jgi:NAD(P)-dependent dehydrogenase (short-subunit alcohol dehydrogenase family)
MLTTARTAFSLPDQCAVVLGAGSGIGRGVACTLARLGSAVVVADIDEPAAAETAATIIAAGGRALSRRVDVADPSATRALFDQAIIDVGRFDILVNSVGVTRYIDFLEVTPQDWDWIAGINLRGLFFATQAAAERMAAQGGGRIVNIASTAGKGHKYASNPVYASTKGAVVILGRNAASRFGPSNVTVNTVCPGLTMTPLMEHNSRSRSAEVGKSYEDFVADLSAIRALNRINTVEDVALAVAFLVSPAARNITGQSLNVDAGLVWD